MPGPGRQSRLQVGEGLRFTHERTKVKVEILLDRVDPPVDGVRPADQRTVTLSVMTHYSAETLELAKGVTQRWWRDEFILDIEVLDVNRTAARVRFFAPPYILIEQMEVKAATNKVVKT